MRKVKFLPMFVLLVLLLNITVTTVVGQEPLPQSLANEERLLLRPDTVAMSEDTTVTILQTVEEYFDAKLQIRLGEATAATLERFFDQENSESCKALQREIAKAQGLFERIVEVGPPVQDGSVKVEVRIQEKDDLTADVAVREVQSYVILHQSLSERTTEEVFDHVLHLVLKNGQWLVVRDDYFDPGGDAMLTRENVASPSTTDVPDDLGLLPDQGAEGEAFPEGIYLYNRTAAYNYAEAHWNNYNNWYKDFCSSGGDCANFASQVVLAGGYPKQWIGSYQWWYNHNGTQNPWNDTWTSSWVNVWPQKLALDYHYGAFVGSASSLKRGDLVYMDWEGNGSWDHVAVVVVADPSGGNPLLDAHCNDRHKKPLSWFGAVTNYYFRVFDSVWLPWA